MKAGVLALAGVAALAAVLVTATGRTNGAWRQGVERVNGKAEVDDSMELSSNWSGYVATGSGSTPLMPSTTTQFTRVTATWKQPAATCGASGVTSASALWVGLGGYSEKSNALEQAGTSADCTATGKASYYAWYELVPEPAITIKSLRIEPGDTITASVVVTGTDVWLWVKNRTRKVVFSKHVTVAAPELTSAEWVAEAPSECTSNGYCRQLPLANFGSVRFTRVAALAAIADLGNQGGTITSTLWQTTPVQLVPRPTERFFGDRAGRSGTASDAAGATPVELSADGRSFTLDWVASAKAPS